MRVKTIDGFLLLCFLKLVAAWPSGAPNSACATLKPKHLFFSPKPISQSPFRMITEKSDFGPNDTIRVRIYSPGEGIIFRGMIVQAYNPNNNYPIGQFRPGEGLKLLTSCSAVTHKDAKEKKAVTLYWEPPPRASGKVLFRGTIVQKFSVYFKDLLAVIDLKYINS